MAWHDLLVSRTMLYNRLHSMEMVPSFQGSWEKIKSSLPATHESIKLAISRLAESVKLIPPSTCGHLSANEFVITSSKVIIDGKVQPAAGIIFFLKHICLADCCMCHMHQNRPPIQSLRKVLDCACLQCMLPLER